MPAGIIIKREQGECVIRPFIYYPVHVFLRHARKNEISTEPPVGIPKRIQRAGAQDVPVLFYRPKAGGDRLPVLFHLHGGGWLFGNAQGVDGLSQYLADRLGCAVINIDYRLADEAPFPYPQTETADVAQYVLNHAGTFGIDPDKASVMGYSAGGHIAAGAAMLLRDRGIRLQKQILCYPFLDFTCFDYASYLGRGGLTAPVLSGAANKLMFAEMKREDPLLSPGHAPLELYRDLPPAILVACGVTDPLSVHAASYAKRLNEAGVKTDYLEYPDAFHGFIEGFGGTLPPANGQCEIAYRALEDIAGLSPFGD